MISGPIRRIDADTIGFTLNAGTEITSTTNIPDADSTAWNVIQLRATASPPVAVSIDLDFFDLGITDLNREDCEECGEDMPLVLAQNYKRSFYDDYLYVGGVSEISETWVEKRVKVSPATFTDASSLPDLDLIIRVTTLGNGARWICVDNVSDYDDQVNEVGFVYVLTTDDDGKALVVRLAGLDLAFVDSLTIEGCFDPRRMLIDDDYLYVCGDSVSGESGAGVITRINHTAFTFEDTTEIAADGLVSRHPNIVSVLETKAQSSAPAQGAEDGLIYGFSPVYPPSLFVIDKSTMAVTLSRAADELSEDDTAQWIEITVDQLNPPDLAEQAIFIQTPGNVLRFKQSDLSAVDITAAGFTMAGSPTSLDSTQGFGMPRHNRVNSVFVGSTEDPANLYYLYYDDITTIYPPSLGAHSPTDTSYAWFSARDKNYARHWYAIVNAPDSANRAVVQLIEDDL